VKERPILFSAPMVRAILAGRKTVTRRIVRIDESPVIRTHGRPQYQRGLPSNATNVRMCGHYVKADAPEGSNTVSARVVCPYGSTGDRLWVRETFGAHVDHPDALTMPEYEGGHDPARLLYRADETRGLTQHYAIPWDRVPWKPSIHMPRWASRITLEITSVHVERLQAITEDGAKAEGVDNGPGRGGHLYPSPRAARGPMGFRNRFAELWDEINGKRAPWKANPWVWCVAFRRVQP